MLSILIPTYNRPNHLNSLVESLVLLFELKNYSYPLEIIIGNDNPMVTLTISNQSSKNINIKIINNKINIGETENINNLLRNACHQYIACLFDDDMIEWNFFNAFEYSINIYIKYDAFYFRNSIFNSNNIYTAKKNNDKFDIKKINGVDFIKTGLYKTFLGFIAIYNRQSLLSLTGIKKLSNNAIGVNTEFCLIYQAISFNTIIYTEKKLVRTCLNNLSYSSTNFDFYPYYISSVNMYKYLNVFVDAYLNHNEKRKFLDFVKSKILITTLTRSFYSLGINRGLKILLIHNKRLNSIYDVNSIFILSNVIFMSFFSSIYKKIIPNSVRYRVRMFFS